MEKISQPPSEWAEIVYSSSDSAVSQSIRRALKSGVLRKLAPRLYTSNLRDTPENIVKRNLYHILSHFFPGSIISYRSALEGGAYNGVLFLTFRYTKKINLPGFTIRLIEGHGPVEGDTSFMDHLFFASRERALLENLVPSRDRGAHTKSLTRKFIEEYLDKLCRNYGVEELNTLRDKARNISKILNMVNEFKILDKMIGALLGTKTAEILTSNVGIARAKGIPYDSNRLELLTLLWTTLNNQILPIVKSPIYNEKSLSNFAFFESYFSNYIEGTEFEIKEAEDIIFNGKIFPSRPQDSHDILGTFKIVSSLNEMHKVPSSNEMLFDLLKKRHFTLMSIRTETEPGQFKTRVNRAGNTVFVDPSLVIGTLTKGFSLYETLKPGIARALFMMFLISEVHPFIDGNARIARIMMNAELDFANESRIIIPTVYREDYLLALRRLSRSHDPDAYIRMMLRAQNFSASIHYSEYQECLAQFNKSNAFLEPTEGKLQF